ncbi:MAG TPA: preprotein translocase subunit SecE [Anaerolineae bacterium]|nr:preprotein translocase subunit SecE [Anaerolineae bacterium]
MASDVTEKKTKKTSKRAEKKASEKKEKQANALARYLRETRGELDKVTWPTREESIRLTLIVIAVTIFMAALLAGFDFVFSWAFEQLVEFVI